MKPIVTLCVGFLITTYLFTITSCDKNTDCKANILCVDSLGLPMNNAAVSLFATVKTAQNSTLIADVKANGTSDASGQVRFTFKLPAIYDVRATLVVTSPTTRTLVGTGIIKLEEGKGVDKKIIVK